MPELSGFRQLAASLGGLKVRADEASTARVVVSYSAAYAIFVHENLTAVHPVGQAKFLEQPTRTLRGELANMIRAALQKGASMASALLMAGLRLQRESQKLCPVDTGALRASATTRIIHE